MIIIIIGSLTYNVPKILKYTPLSTINAKTRQKPGGDSCFRIIQANIRMENREAEKVMEIVRKYKPDIFFIAEPDKWWADQLVELEKEFPFTVKQPKDNTYGMILYSRFELKRTEVNFLVKEDIPSIFSIIVLPNKQEFNLHCLHPEPPRPGSDTYERDAELLLVGKDIKKTNRPALVIGDLNDVAWSYTSELFQRYSELLDPREGRGFFNTYNAKIPFFRYPLDHFFYSEDFGLVQLKKLEYIGSDHFPMLMDLCLEKEVDHAVNQEEADQEDHENVEKKIEQGLEKESQV